MQQWEAKLRWVIQDVFSRQTVQVIVSTASNTDVSVTAQDAERSGALRGLHLLEESAIVPHVSHGIESQLSNVMAPAAIVHHRPQGHVNRITGLHQRLNRHPLTSVPL